MAIYTQYGSEVEIIAANVDTGEVNIRYDDGEVIQSHISCLKADNGLPEIVSAMHDTFPEE